MKDFNKSHNIAGQSNINVQKSNKHDANLQKNSSLYFQIGLILCLLGTYGLFEMKFETKDFNLAVLEPLGPEDDLWDEPTYVVEPNEPSKVEPIEKPKERRLIDDPVIVDDDTPDVVETPNIVTDPPTTDKPMNPKDFVEPKKPVEKIEGPINLNKVEIVPVYPGCEKKTTNTERIKCMNEKITKLVQRKFDTDLAGELGLFGTQRINVQFKIDKSGNVTEILTRAPHPSLEKEAERVTNKIPQMEPGLQRKKPVSVIYNLPIVFKVH